ncbi:MAG: hypothetical protein ACYC36_02405 [Bellilinea sp.]
MSITRDLFRAANIDLSVKRAFEGVSDFIDRLITAAIAQIAYNINSGTTGLVLTAANISGGSNEVVLNMNGTLTAGANAQLPTAAALVAAIPNAQVGQTYKLKVLNGGAGAFAWTITANTGWTLTGTMTVAQNTEREFLVTITAVPTLLSDVATATLQSMGVIGVTAV